MLKQGDLKAWLHRKELRQLDKLLLVLATFDAPAQVKDIKERARAGGLKITDSWNPSSTLSKSDGLAISTPDGWELSEAGKSHLRTLGVSQLAPAAANIAHDLRAELPNIKDADTRSFVEEAIKCYEYGLYRSAVVMSWVGAMHVLHLHVHKHKLVAFNAEASRLDAKWKPAVSTDDLGLMKEFTFLERLAAISVIGKNVKDELQKGLKLRNACGHPNSMKVGPNMVAHHLEVLLLNVFKVF
ncbi:hypothetical protein DLM45_05390 [Hyphomicrobium methylovorum]|uniref:hypothetical protein n=1 Tax=Hyphomicrobium methylovorum TaxID=84 RepID=UPI0015E7E24F|nr:hypothetical protein [Hyphomicrobium methylovorum]MBA2125657.1 hypothetical protein [Hyphomicrobium methylovorum]